MIVDPQTQNYSYNPTTQQQPYNYPDMLLVLDSHLSLDYSQWHTCQWNSAVSIHALLFCFCVQLGGKCDGKILKWDKEMHKSTNVKCLIELFGAIPRRVPYCVQLYFLLLLSHLVAHGATQVSTFLNEEQEMHFLDHSESRMFLPLDSEQRCVCCVQYFNQILTVVLESLDDPNSNIRELSLSLIFEMLSNQVSSP